MKIAIVQPQLVWNDPAANRTRLESLISERLCQGAADLIVLPEMFSTGFVTDPRGKAESGSGSMDWMKGLSKRLGCAVAGSVATEDNGLYFNRFHFVCPDGTAAFYDKRHLFSYAGEDRLYTPGSSRTIVPWRGFRILLQTCYDLRFPVFSRNALVQGNPLFDMIIYVASWPSSRKYAWETLLRARAIENQCYVVGVNRVGSDPGNTYPGASVLIGPAGETLGTCREAEEEVLVCEADISNLKAFRENFPFLADADGFTLNQNLA